MRHKISILLTAALMMVVFTNGVSQNILVKANKMSVQGSSTLHDWESEITKAEVRGEFLISGSQLKEIKNVEVKVPVESIKSTKGKMMDNKTYDAFNASRNPNIVYKVTNAKINAANGTIDANGTLTMAGVSKPMDVQGKYTVLENGDIRLTLSRTFKMSEFKMDPPTAMMGTVKVGDEVTVNFDLVLDAKTIVQ
ncbi:MAG TPA: YceI family protein [Ohtaekwangia sp.]|nr:YceI family protein [Ohtaekwangia sp.]